MKRVIFIGILLFSISLFSENLTVDSSLGGFSINVNEPSNTNSDTKNANIVDELANRLETIESKYKQKLNKLDQKRIQNVIDEMYELLALLPEDLQVESIVQESNNSNTYIENSNSSNSTSSSNTNVNINISTNEVATNKVTEVEEVVEKNEAMSSAAFQNFLSSLKNESFADDKLRVVKITSNKSFFSVGQIKTVVEQFSFDEDRIEAVSLLYPKVVDEENAHLILDSFTFSSDKEEIEKIISN